MPTADEYEASMRSRLSQGAAAAMATRPEGSPDEAAKTLANSAKQGIPFGVGNLDPAAFNQEAETQENSQIIKGDPAIQKYLTDHDFAAPVSHDDIPALSATSKALRGFGDVFSAAWEGAKAGWGEEPETKEGGALYQFAEQYVKSKEAQSRVFGALITGGAAGLGEAYRQLGGSDANANRLVRDLVIWGNMGLAALGSHPVAPPELLPTARATELYRRAGETPKPGVDPALDKVNIAQTRLEEANYDKVQEALAQSKTRERSPEATKAFVETVAPGRTVGIPADAIRETFAERAPEQFSWLPDFAERLKRADETGGDVRIPLGDWLAAPEEVQKAFKDDLRLREDGLTKREADELDKGPPESYAWRRPRVTEFPGEDEVKKELWLKPLFDESTFKGVMTDADFARYSRKLQGLDEDAEAAALRNAEREAKRRQTAEWKENRERVREAVEEDINARPDVMADKFLRTRQTGMYAGGAVPEYAVKLDRDAIPVKYNQLFKRYAAVKGGVHPDDIAMLHGYGSGRAMLEDLITLDNRRGEAQPAAYIRSLIEAETDRRMETRYGDLQKNILAEAREAVGTGGQADLLADEMFALARKQGELPPQLTRGYIEGRIRDHFGSLPAGDGRKVSNFVKDVGRAGRQAETALLKGDLAEAFRAKQRQFFAFQLMREAQKLEKLAKRTDAAIKRFSRNQTIESIDQKATDQIHKILGDVGVGNEFPLPADTPSLDSFVKNAEGQAAVAPWLTLDGPKPQLKDLNVDYYRGFAKSIQSLIHVGRESQKVLTAQAKEDLAAAASQMVGQLDRWDLIHQPLNPGVAQRPSQLTRWVTALHILPERVLDYSDKFEPDGAFSRYIDRPLRNANSKKLVLQEQVRKRLQGLREYTDASVNDSIDNTLIPDTMDRSGFMGMNRHNLRILMAYTGTESRFEKLVRGFGLLDQEAESLYGASPREVMEAGKQKVMDFVNEHATEKDWKWVQGMWDIFDYLKPEADEMNLRDTGVPVDEEPKRPVTTPHGKFEGGYFPLVYDRLRSDIENVLSQKHDLFERHYVSATTPHGYTQSLTGFSAPLDLKGLLIGSKLDGMVHDIAFREAVRSVDKILKHPEWRDAMNKKWGEEITRTFPSWLRDVANVHNVDDSHAQGLAYASAWVRRNVISTLISLNPGTFVKHGLTALSMSMSQVGPKEFVKSAAGDIGLRGMIGALRDIIKQPEVKRPSSEWVDSLRDITDPGPRGDLSREFVLESSPAMRNRQARFMDNTIEAYDRASKAGAIRTFFNFREAVMNVGRTPVSWSDAFSAFPTWTTTYKESIAKGMSHADAVFQADKDVSRAHGSTSIIDKPVVGRQRGELGRWFVGLYNFWNHAFNNQVQILWDMAARARGQDEPGANIPSITGRAIALAIVPIIVEELAAPALTEHESLAKQALEASVRFFGAGLIGVREITNAVAGGYEPSVGMLGTLMKGAQAIARDAYKYGIGKSVSKDWLTHATTALGFATGIGSSQVGRTGTFSVGYFQGRERPVSLAEWRQGLRTGHVKARKIK